MKVLKTSNEVRKELTALMAPSNRRRVAISAFVGKGARDYIRKPRGVELICWPRAGGTNPQELRRLKKSGVKIRFANSLHMKVYWAAGRGTLITSANLSTNALGAGNLKEIGVLLPESAVNIDELIRSLRSRPFNKADIQKLEKADKSIKTRKPRYQRDTDEVDYKEWYSLPSRADWKIGWFDSRKANLSFRAKNKIRSDYARSKATDFINCNKNDYKKNDWVLLFLVTKYGAVELKWLYVDFIIRMSKNEANVMGSDYAYQAIQVLTPLHYPSPPFKINRPFKTAFKLATRTYGIGKIERTKATKPQNELLSLIKKKLK